MNKVLRNTIKKLRQTFAANDVAHTISAKILMNLIEWRRNGGRSVKIGNDKANEIGWESFFHGRVASELRRILPRAGEPDNKKWGDDR